MGLGRDEEKWVSVTVSVVLVCEEKENGKEHSVVYC